MRKGNACAATDPPARKARRALPGYVCAISNPAGGAAMATSVKPAPANRCAAWQASPVNPAKRGSCARVACAHGATLSVVRMAAVQPTPVTRARRARAEPGERHACSVIPWERMAAEWMGRVGAAMAPRARKARPVKQEHARAMHCPVRKGAARMVNAIRERHRPVAWEASSAAAVTA